MNVPLAERVRPVSLSDFISQAHLVGEGGVLTAQIQSGQIPSLIFWGPPGTGKTTLAQIIAHQNLSRARLVLNAGTVIVTIVVVYGLFLFVRHIG